MRRDPLEKLSSAGRDASPPFSETLHGRVMADVRRARQGEVRSSLPVAWWWVGPATAAAAAVAIVVWIWPTSRTPTDQAVAVDLAAVSEVRELDGMVRETVGAIGQGRYAYLDRDGRRLVGFLMSHIPSVPSHAAAGGGAPAKDPA